MRGLGQVTDVLSQALFPVAQEATQGLDPRTVKAMQRQGLMQLGLGMMAAKERGAGLGTGLNMAFNQAQQDIHQGLGQALISRRANREDERLDLQERRFRNAELQSGQDSLQQSIDRKRDRLQWNQQFNAQQANTAADNRRADEQMAIQRVLAGRREETPVNSQLVTRPVGDGLVQDFAFNPRTNGFEPLREPYKPATTYQGNVQEGERKAAALGTRLEAAMQALGGVEAKNPGASRPGLIERGLETVGLEAAANVARSSDRQEADAAQLDALDAALTLATGAAYTKEQLQNLRKSYFPQLGDSDAAVKAKEKRFATIVKTARIASGRAEPSIDRAVGGNSQAEVTATGPNGQKVVLRDGQWVPL